MDLDSNTTSELFFCFASRLTSSSMKITSKSILSPSHHTREPSQISVSSSLNRRLRSNGSMKGGHASPMFPTNGKKKGFENPEPSSPKVTCIGQVRVKTKKQGKKFRACRSKRRGEVSFRKVDHNNNRGSTNGIDSSFHLLRSTSHHHNQQQECRRWVHFPVTICEALRGFGAEFNCFLPCRSSCMANQRDSAKEREIELVVGGEDDGEKRESGSEMIMMMRSSQRRHVFEDIGINDFCNKKVSDDDDEEKEKEEEGRVNTICIPPKNALLLMRCRSDPVKMASLANKFLENPLQQDEQEQEAENGSESEEKEVQEDAVEEGKYEHQEVSEVNEMFVSCEAYEEQEIPEAEPETEAESVLVSDETKVIEEESLGACLKEEMVVKCQEQDQEETLPRVSLDLDKVQVEENVSENEELQQGDEAEAEDEIENVSVKEEEEEEEGEDNQAVVEEEEKETRGRSEPVQDESKECQSEEKLLPDCLLLVIGEPKLSMELSKETWVCSTDFIRRVPEKKKLLQEVKEKDGGDQPKPRISIDRNPPPAAAAPILLQPRRSSCSFPIAPPMATVVAAAAKEAGCGGGKLVGGKGCEPFVLARCKSEPRRSAAKLAPDTCFWKNRKLEPATVGVGAAGVGF